MTTPRQRRRSTTLVVGIVLLVAAAVAGTVAGAAGGRAFTAAFDVEERTLPVDARLDLDARDYDVVQRAGTRSGDATGFDGTRAAGLAAQGVTVTGPDGGRLAVRAPTGTGTLEVNGVSYVVFGYVTVPAGGTYRLQVAGPDGAVVALVPSLGSSLRAALPWVGLGLAAAVTGLVGIVLVVVGAVRRRRPTAAG